MTTKFTLKLVFLSLLWLSALPVSTHAQDDLVNISFDPLPEQCVDNFNSCTARVSYGFQLEVADCPFGQLEVEVFVNFFNDGSLLPVPNALSGSFPDYSAAFNFPPGTHSFEVVVNDGCGNTQSATLDFDVVDCDVSPPACATGVVVEIFPVDTLGDELIDDVQGFAYLDNLLGQDLSDCSPPVSYSVSYEGGSYTAGQDSLLLNCDNLGNTTLEVHAQDALGNTSFCQAVVSVQNNSGYPCPDEGEPGIAGMITTEQGLGLAGVEIFLSGGANESTIAGTGGVFFFSPPASGLNYSLRPSFDGGDPLNGVSTLDLILISRHILGVAPFESHYQRIAADTNGSGHISALDLIQLRRMILGIENGFDNVPNWRFVDADYVFPVLTNPQVGNFPEVINLGNFGFFSGENNFIAIKIGDVSGDAELD